MIEAVIQIVAIAAMAGLVILSWAIGFRNKPRDHYLYERYGIEEKPEGWNKAVLGHFHAGPELRDKTPEFRGAFYERATQHTENDPAT